jgi:hypothetical protein
MMRGHKLSVVLVSAVLVLTSCISRDDEVEALEGINATLKQLNEENNKIIAIQRETISVCGEELGKYRAEEKERREHLTKAMVELKNDPFLNRLKRAKNDMPCKLDTIEWMSRVDGAAKLPPGTFKRFLQEAKSGDLELGLTDAQKKKLARAMDQNPPPACTDKGVR